MSIEQAAGRALRAFGRRAKPYAPALIASVCVGTLCVQGILARAGRPAAPLDDAFIHLQFARRLAEGGFYSFMPGEGYSTGATSLLWPLLLAPFHAIGLRGLSLLWVPWVIGTLAHAALAVEAARLADRLAGKEAGVGAGMMCSVFGAFAWFAWSGMETIPFAWLLLRAARVGSEPSGDHKAELIALGILGPLLRPEGLLVALIAAIGVAIQRRREGKAWIAVTLAPLLGAPIPPALHLIFAGHMTPSTVIVKWLAADPHYNAWTLAAAVLENARLLVTSLMYGEDWTSLFLPEGSNLFILLGLPALVIAGERRGARLSAVFVAMIALGSFIPCSYSSFLWNRVRYLWPFAAAWFVMVACLAREIGDLSRRLRPSLTFMTPLVCGLFTGGLVSRLPWAARDLGESAFAVDQQQVALALWAAESLPPTARVGVNDTGAIAYLSGRRTFDVVGLTTEGEARYWVAGAGSRFEHYERMPRKDLPTHYIVYPHWMACPAVLGDEMRRATVSDQSILGGATMVAFEAKYDALGSGAHPRITPEGATLVDELDVSDLESERAHGYELFGAWDSDNQAALLPSPASDLAAHSSPTWQRASLGAESMLVADGGRLHRAIDRFRMKLPRGPSTLILRAAGESDVTLSISIGGHEVGVAALPVGTWVERSVDLPPGEGGETAVEVAARDGRQFGAFHYWVYAR